MSSANVVRRSTPLDAATGIPGNKIGVPSEFASAVAATAARSWIGTNAAARSGCIRFVTKSATVTAGLNKAPLTGMNDAATAETIAALPKAPTGAGAETLRYITKNVAKNSPKSTRGSSGARSTRDKADFGAVSESGRSLACTSGAACSAGSIGESLSEAVDENMTREYRVERRVTRRKRREDDAKAWRPLKIDGSGVAERDANAKFRPLTLNATRFWEPGIDKRKKAGMIRPISGAMDGFPTAQRFREL